MSTNVKSIEADALKTVSIVPSDTPYAVVFLWIWYLSKCSVLPFTGSSNLGALPLDHKCREKLL